jgi:hypothetical protein
MWVDLLSHGVPTLPCRSDCQVLIIYLFDILMLVFVRTPLKFDLCRRVFFGLVVGGGGRGVVGKILQLFVWSVYKGCCRTEYVPSR